MSNANRMYVILNETFVPPKEFNERSIVFSPAQTTDQYERDTVLTVSGIPGRGYYGELDVYYNRLQLSHYGADFTFTSESELTKEDVIFALAGNLGIEIEADDFEDFVIPDMSVVGEHTFVATVKPSSIQWLGSIEITLLYGVASLESMVTRRNLSAYTHPNTTPRFSSRMSTWGYDFSGIQNALKPNTQNQYTDWPTVQMTASLLGIPAWPRNSVVDKATADVPDSNPAFQRVVIQSAISSNVLAGPMYFHYNPI